MAEKQSKPTQEEALREIRNEIDGIDQQIQTLLNQRARCAERVADVKAEFDQQNAVFYRPEREAQVLRKVMGRNEGPLANPEIARLFREIMSVCLAHEQPLNVVFLGPEGSCSQLAALKHFGNSIKAIALDSVEQLFSEVESGNADYAVIAIESQDTQAIKWLASHSLNVVGEVELDSQFGRATTRYLIIGKQQVEPSGEDKTALILTVDKASLDTAALITQFEQSSVTPIEMQQLDDQSVTLFYIDFSGYFADSAVQQLLNRLENQPFNIKLLGSFPKAVL